MVAIPILTISAIVLSLALTHLITGLSINGTSFGLPADSTIIEVLFAVVFGFIIALIIVGPFLGVVHQRRKGKNRR